MKMWLLQMARKFLFLVAAIIVLVIVGAFVLNIWSKELTEYAFVPRGEFVEQKPLDQNAYQNPDMWFSRPGIGPGTGPENGPENRTEVEQARATGDPARWQPAIRGKDRALPSPAKPADNFAVFFLHPTSFLDRTKWNAPLDDAASQNMARAYLRTMASPFNRASEIWAPKYRQATFGAFLTDTPEATQALEAAYKDAKQSFAMFLASVDGETPIVLAGHDQGSLHLLRLIREDIVGSSLAQRIAAIYIVGWPVSIEHDLAALGFPACAVPDQSGCIMSWSSFAEPTEPGQILDAYRTSIGFDGKPRGASQILCTNPLTGGIGGAAPAAQNLGTLVPDDTMLSGDLVPGAVPARCDDDGLLLIGDPPRMGNAVMPGNNYHIYDIPLFWKNLQQDVTNRAAAWTLAH